jgi:hypothetical protein
MAEQERGLNDVKLRRLSKLTDFAATVGVLDGPVNFVLDGTHNHVCQNGHDVDCHSIMAHLRSTMAGRGFVEVTFIWPIPREMKEAVVSYEVAYGDKNRAIDVLMTIRKQTFCNRWAAGTCAISALFQGLSLVLI